MNKTEPDRNVNPEDPASLDNECDGDRLDNHQLQYQCGISFEPDRMVIISPVVISPLTNAFAGNVISDTVKVTAIP